MPKAPAAHARVTPERDARLGRLVLLAGLAAVLLYGAWMGRKALRDPGLIYLPAFAPAEWVLHDDPIALDKRDAKLVARGFRMAFNVSGPLTDALLQLRAMTRCSVLIDGKVVAIPAEHPQGWKAELQVQLAPHLTPGRHEITIFAQNHQGPALLWAHCAALGLKTDASWESSTDGVTWRKVRLATDRPVLALSRDFETPLHAVATRWLFFLPLFAAVFVLLWRAEKFAWMGQIRAVHVRWMVLAGWALMAGNNAFKLPAPAGFDTTAHFQYVEYLINHGRVPFANEGWQLFQSPLAYVIGTAIFQTCSKFTDMATAVTLVRFFPLLCGLLQVELCYRALRRLFPQRDGLQILGTLFAGLLPMNLYLSQYFGNEPLSGVLCAAVFVLCLKLLRPAPGESLRWTPLWIGVLFGLGLLTKVSAVLIGFPLLITLAVTSFTPGSAFQAGVRRFCFAGATIGGIAFALAGWYYIRNWIHLGRPFVGGWDSSRGFAWWQDHGFRTASDLFSFGSAFVRPIYAGLQTVWDGLYASFWCDTYLSSAILASAAPKWNYGFMMAGVLLALVPTAALLTGVVLAVRQVAVACDRVWLVTLACLGAYGIALIHHVLTLPYYCSVKSFYTVGATPAYALLFTGGIAWLTRGSVARAALGGLFACWVFAVYVGFFSRA